jgi:hypothetical protein
MSQHLSQLLESEREQLERRVIWNNVNDKLNQYVEFEKRRIRFIFQMKRN